MTLILSNDEIAALLPLAALPLDSNVTSRERGPAGSRKLVVVRLVRPE